MFKLLYFLNLFIYLAAWFALYFKFIYYLNLFYLFILFIRLFI